MSYTNMETHEQPPEEEEWQQQGPHLWVRRPHTNNNNNNNNIMQASRPVHLEPVGLSRHTRLHTALNPCLALRTTNTVGAEAREFEAQTLADSETHSIEGRVMCSFKLSPVPMKVSAIIGAALQLLYLEDLYHPIQFMLVLTSDIHFLDYKVIKSSLKRLPECGAYDPNMNSKYLDQGKGKTQGSFSHLFLYVLGRDTSGSSSSSKRSVMVVCNLDGFLAHITRSLDEPESNPGSKPAFTPDEGFLSRYLGTYPPEVIANPYWYYSPFYGYSKPTHRCKPYPFEGVIGPPFTFNTTDKSDGSNPEEPHPLTYLPDIPMQPTATTRPIVSSICTDYLTDLQPSIVWHPRRFGYLGGESSILVPLLTSPVVLIDIDRGFKFTTELKGYVKDTIATDDGLLAVLVDTGTNQILKISRLSEKGESTQETSPFKITSLYSAEAIWELQSPSTNERSPRSVACIGLLRDAAFLLVQTACDKPVAWVCFSLLQRVGDKFECLHKAVLETDGESPVKADIFPRSRDSSLILFQNLWNDSKLAMRKGNLFCWVWKQPLKSLNYIVQCAKQSVAFYQGSKSHIYASLNGYSDISLIQL